MDEDFYVNEIERLVDDPDALIRIRVRLAADMEVDLDTKDQLDARIGTYLLDMERSGFRSRRTRLTPITDKIWAGTPIP